MEGGREGGREIAREQERERVGEVRERVVGRERELILTILYAESVPLRAMCPRHAATSSAYSSLVFCRRQGMVGYMCIHTVEPIYM